MTPSPVSRCIAVASHGRRCQQSPFRGSPYCWHHTQSRKVWAPSRPRRNVPTNVPVPPDALEKLAAPVEVMPAQVDAAARLVKALGPERVEALVEFLESDASGAFRVVKVDGQVVDSVVEPPPAAKRRRRPSDPA